MLPEPLPDGGKKPKGNTDPWREVPLRKSLLSLVRQWHDEDTEHGFEYVVTYKGKQVAQIRHACRWALKRAGITRHIRPYEGSLQKPSLQVRIMAQ